MRLVLTYRLPTDPSSADQARVGAVAGVTVLDEFPGTVLVEWGESPESLALLLPDWHVGIAANLELQDGPSPARP